MPEPTADQQLLADAVQRYGGDPWFVTLLHAAIEQTKDAQQAIAAAEKAFAANPKDTSTPQDDDADALFAKG